MEEVAEVPAEDVEAVVVVANAVRVEMASAVNVVSVLSAASALTVTEVLPAAVDLVEDMEESVELPEEDAVETVEAAEVAAKSSALTKTPSPPWDKPHRRYANIGHRGQYPCSGNVDSRMISVYFRSKEADKARKIFSFRLERILHKQI